VGTPGRILDHLRRGSLKTDQLSAVVLDEADEMLRMGFIDDVELIISGAPKTCQMAMFSATMPAPIRRIAKRYLKEPIEIKIASRTSTVESVEQHYLLLNDNQKLDALTRLLEVKEYDGVLIFVRTKSATTEVAEKLEARGFAVSALNGDMSQAQREKAVLHLKQRKLDIVVATDVAARGLDVERLSLVINFDIPNCTESYVHRIGRTARAGRVGQTILFTTTRERGLLRAIENATKQKIEPMRLPSSRELAQRRTELFKERIVHTIANQSLDFFQEYLGVMQKELDMPLKELASALLYLAQKDQPLQVEGKAFELVPPKKPDARPIAPIKKFERQNREIAPTKKFERPTKDKKRGLDNSIKFERYRLEVGKKHKVRVADIVGAIVNEAEIESRFIGDIRLYDDYSTIELPAGMPKGIFQHLKKLHVRQIKLNISLMTD
jgi:ATP-dependent RNA helicase DeaD